MTAMTFAATAHNHASTENTFNPDTQRIKSHLFFLADDLLEGTRALVAMKLRRFILRPNLPNMV